MELQKEEAGLEAHIAKKSAHLHNERMRLDKAWKELTAKEGK